MRIKKLFILDTKGKNVYINVDTVMSHSGGPLRTDSSDDGLSLSLSLSLCFLKRNQQPLNLALPMSIFPLLFNTVWDCLFILL